MRLLPRRLRTPGPLIAAGESLGPSARRAGEQQQRRWLHRSHLAKKLETQDRRRDKHLDAVPNARVSAAAASAGLPGSCAAARRVFRLEAEDFARELLVQKQAIGALFTEEQKASLFRRSKENEGEGHSGAVQDAKALSDKQGPTATSGFKTLSPADEQDLKQRLRKSMAAWNLLRPHALPFYKEDALLNLESKLNEVTLKHSPLQQQLLHQEELQRRGEVGTAPADLVPPSADPLSFNLPVLNARGFVLAVSACANSIADSLEPLLRLLQVEERLMPPPSHPFRLKLMLDALGESFRLEKTPAAAAGWVARCWSRLKPLLPEPFQRLSDSEVTAWLEGHLRRVEETQRRYSQMPIAPLQHLTRTSAPPSLSPPPGTVDSRFAAFCHRRLHSDFYDVSLDFVFDGGSVDEDTIDFFSQKWSSAEGLELLRGCAALFGISMADDAPHSASVKAAFERLLQVLVDIGIEDWIRLGPEHLESFLPQGPPPAFSASPSDVAAARLFLKAAARGRGNLLDFQALDPYRLLHGFSAQSVEEELAKLPENPWLSDQELDRQFDVQAAAGALAAAAAEGSLKSSSALEAFSSRFGCTPLEALVNNEVEFLRNAGPAEWESSAGEGGGEAFSCWRWHKPVNTVWDNNRGVYVRERGGVDPTLCLNELRQTLLQINRMMSMSKEGRVYYYRAISAVGNGRGVFGIGLAFGKTPADARANAALAALQNLHILDLDSSGVLTTPVHGQEYSAHVKIVPRPMGRGLKSNLRFLPLLYLTGLQNCKISFAGPSSRSRWFSRSKALMRALNNIQSRNTIAKSRGVKVDVLVAPGDSWTHWPDSWFRPIAADYEAKLNAIKKRRHATAKWSFRSKVGDICPEECRPEFTPYTWKSPLQRWAERQRLLKLTSHNVKEIVLKPPSEQELHLTHECAAAEKALKKQGASGAVAAEEA